MNFHSRTTKNNEEFVKPQTDDPYKIILHKIESLGKYYGMVYYDTVLNKISFKDTENRTSDITNSKKINIKSNKLFNNNDNVHQVDMEDLKNMIIKITYDNINKKATEIYSTINEFKKNNGSINTILNPMYKGIWDDSISYNVNDIVKYKNSIYISCLSNINSNPETDNLWLLIDSPVKYIGKWVYGNNYIRNNIVIDEIDSSLYICCESNKSHLQPSLDSNNWSPFMPISNLGNNKNINTNNEYFYGLFTNSTCCCHYDTKLRITLYDKSNCHHSHNSINESKINAYMKQLITINEQINIPINLVGSMIGLSYNYNKELDSLYILGYGLFKITYNICYHGSIYDVMSYVKIVKDNDSEEIFSNSKNKSTNRINNDNNDDYYEKIKDQHHYDDVTQYINHSFVGYIKESKFKKHKIMLMLRFSNRNNGKSIFVHPIETWISIEKIIDKIY